jgi:ferric-dicitrate binding protein FerR (iron transport regulator)
MKTNQDISQEDWELLAKALFDEPTSQVGQVSVDEAELQKIRQLGQNIDLHYQLRKYNTSGALSQVKSRIQKDRPNAISRPLMLRALKVAAAIILALIIGSAAYYVGQRQLGHQHIAGVMVDDAGLSQIELSDGTLVTLNRDTKINYPDQFANDVREVSIKGEAFFEVTPNPSKPFIIHAGEATVKVLGTSFSVNAYPENDRVEVIVATGKVEVSKLENPYRITLDPGEKGTFMTSSKELIKSLNYDPNFLAWKTRTFIFNETSLTEVIKQLNKVYRVQIELPDHKLDNMLLNAHFEKETLDFILEVISTTHGLNVQKKGGHYVLTKKEA